MELHGWSVLSLVLMLLAGLIAAWGLGHQTHRRVVFSGISNQGVTLEVTNLLMFMGAVFCWPVASLLVFVNAHQSDWVAPAFSLLLWIPIALVLLHIATSIVMFFAAQRSRGRGFADVAESMVERYLDSSARQAILLGCAFAAILVFSHLMQIRFDWKWDPEAGIQHIFAEDEERPAGFRMSP